jgi:hypothetical protein
MNSTQNNVASTRAPFPLPQPISQAIVGGLHGLVDIDGGPTPEQTSILNALATHILGIDMRAMSNAATITPYELGMRLQDARYQRIFMQIAIVLDLCRHPKNEKQFRRVEEYAAAFKFSGVELTVLRDFAHLSAIDATTDFIRLYGSYTPELSEHHGQFPAGDPHGLDDHFFERIEKLSQMPYGSLGWAFTNFYSRSKLKVPGRDSPNPSYYVSHDMGHVISGYEATGPGEIALGAIKLALDGSDANWMASLANFLIHEVGLFTHGTDVQFIPHGHDGDPYYKAGVRGAMDVPGAADLFAEALQRGAACGGDFTKLDHLAIAHMPLIEIRRELKIPPLSKSMYDDKEFWPSSY